MAGRDCALEVHFGVGDAVAHDAMAIFVVVVVVVSHIACTRAIAPLPYLAIFSYPPPPP